MNHRTLILQKSPRVEITFQKDDFEILKSDFIVVQRTKYRELNSVVFTKGKILWITGLLTAVIDLIANHGFGQWKRGKGKLELNINWQNHTIELENYDREQTLLAVQQLKIKTR